AARIVEQMVREIGDTTGRAWEPELYRQRADLLLALDPSKIAEAESCLKKAIELARAHSSKSLELRASISLAMLWREHNRIDEARALIEPIYRWFEEGGDTEDVSRARDLVAALH